VNTAVSAAGDCAAANAAAHDAVGFDVLIGLPVQPAIGVPLTAKLIVPEGDPPVTAANSVTGWFVAADDGEATSEVELGGGVCVTVSLPEIAATVSVPLIVA
jgi:hypothetical protein